MAHNLVTRSHRQNSFRPLEGLIKLIFIMEAKYELFQLFICLQTSEIISGTLIELSIHIFSQSQNLVEKILNW